MMTTLNGLKMVLEEEIKPYLKEKQGDHVKHRDKGFRKLVQKIFPDYNGTFVDDTLSVIEDTIDEYNGPSKGADKKYQILNYRNIDAETKKQKIKEWKDAARNTWDQKWEIDNQLFASHFIYLCQYRFSSISGYDFLLKAFNTTIRFPQTPRRWLIKRNAWFYGEELQDAVKEFCGVDLHQLKKELVIFEKNRSKKRVTPTQFAAYVKVKVGALKSTAIMNSTNDHLNALGYLPPIQIPTGYGNIHHGVDRLSVPPYSPYHNASPNNTMYYSSNRDIW